jgi:transposase-like protein
MKAQMEEFFARRIDWPIVAVMIDGIEVGGTSVLAAMGIDEDGGKHMLGITQGGSENSTVAVRLLCDLIDRGLDTQTPRLFVLDGGKGIHKAVREVFGDRAVIQRCQVHKKRNVLDHLPQSEQANVSLLLSKAYLEHEYDKAKKLLESTANHLDTRYPKAAASLREGLEETLSVHRLGIPGLLRQTLSNTNPIESANSVCMSALRRVRNWQKSDMVLRNMAAGFMEAERGFRRVKGFRQIPFLLQTLKNLCETTQTPPPLTASIM